MKYRLKKDLPDMKAGEIFDDTDDFGRETSVMFDSRGAYRFDKDNIKHFDEWFEEVDQRWKKPEFDKVYCFVDDTGDIRYKRWRDDSADKIRWSLGNCFKTDKAAERYRDYLKAIITVRQDEGVLTPAQVAKDGYVYYIYDNNEFGPVTYEAYAACISVNTVLFDTKEHVKASRDNHPAEWKTIANYDWSRG